jgi:hypothetical protein
MPRRPVNAPFVIHTKRGDVIIDAEDVDMVLAYNTWNISKRGDVVCYKESGSRDNRKRQVFKLHRVIMNAPNDKVVDHINRDPTDNRKSNLRICIPSENGKNLSKKKNNTSGYVGICWDKFRNKWAATIKVNYKNIHLGRYEDVNEAIKVRKAAEVKYFGDFAPKGI